MTGERRALAIVQARMGSTRLPGKVLHPLGPGTLLSWVVRAARGAPSVASVVVATTQAPVDDAIVEACAALDVAVHRGPTDDVLTRFVGATEIQSGEPIVRLTADCPLLDPDVIDAVVTSFGPDDDYVSTTQPRTLPRGLDVEAFSAQALASADAGATGVERVHVTPFLYQHPERFRIRGLTFAPPADDLRVTVDTIDDLRLVEAVVAELGDRPPPWRELVALLRGRPDLTAINAATRQKELEEG